MTLSKTQPIAFIPYKEVEWVFITGHYDVHLSGLCRYQGNLCWFVTLDNEEDWPNIAGVHIYKLTTLEKVKLIYNKKMFEWCIGYHWTYKNGKRIQEYQHNRKPEWLYKIIRRIYWKR